MEEEKKPKLRGSVEKALLEYFEESGFEELASSFKIIIQENKTKLQPLFHLVTKIRIVSFFLSK